MLSCDRLDPRLHRRGVVAQHMQAGTESDDLDLHFLAEVLVVLRDVRRIVERQIHHRRFVGVHLQDKAMQPSCRRRPLRAVGAARRFFCTWRRRLAARRRAHRRTLTRRHRRSASIFKLVIMHLLSGCCSMTSVAWRSATARPFAAAASRSRTVFSPSSEKSPFLRGTRSGRDAKGDVALVGKRLQQAHDIALERDAGPRRRRACREPAPAGRH